MRSLIRRRLITPSTTIDKDVAERRGGNAEGDRRKRRTETMNRGFGARDGWRKGED